MPKEQTGASTRVSTSVLNKDNSTASMGVLKDNSVPDGVQQSQCRIKGNTYCHVTCHVICCVIGMLWMLAVTALATAALVVSLTNTNTDLLFQCQVKSQGTETNDTGGTVTDAGGIMMTSAERIYSSVSRRLNCLEAILTKVRSSLQIRNCSTSIENICTVDRQVRFCTTSFIQFQRLGELVLDFICLRVEETPEQNPLIATAEIINNFIACICHVPDILRQEQQHDVKCGLQMTRCKVVN